MRASDMLHVIPRFADVRVIYAQPANKFRNVDCAYTGWRILSLCKWTGEQPPSSQTSSLLLILTNSSRI